MKATEPIVQWVSTMDMRDSTTYQGLLEDGRREGMQQTLLRLGRLKFGPPSNAIMATLTAITDVERLLRMAERLLEVSTWGELLATP